jgi:hypothetical protein
MLQAKDGICKQKPDQTEDKKGYAVLLPGLFLFCVQSEKPTKKPFHRAKHRVEKGFPLRIQNLREIYSHRLRQ